MEELKCSIHGLKLVKAGGLLYCPSSHVCPLLSVPIQAHELDSRLPEMRQRYVDHAARCTLSSGVPRFSSVEYRERAVRDRLRSWEDSDCGDLEIERSTFTRARLFESGEAPRNSKIALMDLGECTLTVTTNFYENTSGNSPTCACCGDRSPEVWRVSVNAGLLCGACWSSKTRVERVLAGWQLDTPRRFSEPSASAIGWAQDLQRPDARVGYDDQSGEEFEVWR